MLKRHIAKSSVCFTSTPEQTPTTKPTMSAPISSTPAEKLFGNLKELVSGTPIRCRTSTVTLPMHATPATRVELVVPELFTDYLLDVLKAGIAATPALTRPTIDPQMSDLIQVLLGVTSYAGLATFENQRDVSIARKFASFEAIECIPFVAKPVAVPEPSQVQTSTPSTSTTTTPSFATVTKEQPIAVPKVSESTSISTPTAPAKVTERPSSDENLVTCHKCKVRFDYETDFESRYNKKTDRYFCGTCSNDPERFVRCMCATRLPNGSHKLICGWSGMLKEAVVVGCGFTICKRHVDDHVKNCNNCKQQH